MIYRCLLLSALLQGTITTHSAFAGGNETTVGGDDLAVTVNWRWTGCGNGGYYPVRIRAANRGAPRTLTFELDPPGSHSPMPRVRRTIAIDQNATAEFSLSVPMVGAGTYAQLRVYHDGRELENLGHINVNVPDVSWANSERPALLVIASTGVDCSSYESAVTSMCYSTSPVAAAHHASYGSGRAEDHEVVAPTMLPDSWIDYSGLDLVAVALDTLENLPQSNRSAILKWVQQGGNLIVYDVGADAKESETLSRVLELGLSAERPRWQSARPQDRREISVVKTDKHGNIETTVSSEEKSKPRSRKLRSEFVWPASPETFASTDVLLGRVIGFKDNPFPGSPHDWAWFMNAIGQNRFQWAQRLGTSARQENEEFLKFLIPGIKSVPAYSFLILISVFTIVIGPLNYLFLKRRRRLHLLILTIPIIALATSATLFAYSVVAHGFAVKSRVRSLTVIDQGNRTAVTTARTALYAGLAPSDGLRFSPETAVYPIWPPRQSFEYGVVDWTHSQALTSGWLRSRTRTQFLTVAHRVERGRLDVQTPVKNRLPVANGFEWDLEVLLVADDKGAVYFGDNIPAGASAELTQATQEKLTSAAELLNRSRLETPSGVSGGSTDFFPMGRPRHYYYRYRYGRSTFQATNSLSEQRIDQFQRLPQTQRLPSRTYFAVLKKNPDVEIGVPKTTEIDHLHVVMGHY